MVSSLKKIKLEKGGEDLVLATVRADDVETFVRLRHKSEPTWLLATVYKKHTPMYQFPRDMHHHTITIECSKAN